MITKNLLIPTKHPVVFPQHLRKIHYAYAFRSQIRDKLLVLGFSHAFLAGSTLSVAERQKLAGNLHRPAVKSTTTNISVFASSVSENSSMRILINEDRFSDLIVDFGSYPKAPSIFLL